MKATEEKCMADGQITISQSFGFSASHELRLLPASHKWRRRGHNYAVTASALVRDGAPGDLSPLGDYLAATSLDGTADAPRLGGIGIESACGDRVVVARARACPDAHACRVSVQAVSACRAEGGCDAAVRGGRGGASPDHPVCAGSGP